MSVLDRLTDEERERLRRAAHPDWVSPMLATLSHEVFSSPEWIYERKLDGERCLGFRDGDTVRLWSRNQKLLNAAYPEVVDAVQRHVPSDAVVDGEVVAFEDGRTSFARLQPRMQVSDPDEARRSGVPVFYYLFDVMHLDGHDCTGLPLRTRKKLLAAAVPFEDPLQLCVHRNTDGEAFHAEACAKGWEGLIAKRADGTYDGGRSRSWRKLKCVHTQELVVGGFTDPRGSRVGFGALLVGYHDDGDLVYAGKVGTGFDRQTLHGLRERMGRLERDTSPFAVGDLPSSGVHWIDPELVAQITFTEWTGDGRLRHPRFEGLRRDKDPRDVVREAPA